MNKENPTETAFTPQLEDNEKNFKNLFSGSYDVIFRRFRSEALQKQCLVVYIENLIDKDILYTHILDPLMAGREPHGTPSPGDLFNQVKDSMVSIGNVSEVYTVDESAGKILGGLCLLLIDSCHIGLAISAQGAKLRPVSEVKTESIIRGPQEAFVEELSANIGLLRRRIKTPNLKVEKYTLGTISKTDTVLAYINGIIDNSVLDNVHQLIGTINTDFVPDTNYIQSYLENNLSIFPHMDVTERPDVCGAALAEGRFVILVEGSPFAIIAPTTFAYFLVSSEDYYDRFYFASFIRFLRYFAFVMALFGPSVYIAITTYHPEMLPASLLISVASTRSDVPFPALVEALLLEIAFELIREASARLPRQIAPSLSIVGALVIGQTAVQAGLVGPAMIIVVAITGIASFCIPKIPAGRVIRLLRFPLMLMSATMGIFGIIMGALFILIHMASSRSFGVPYLAPFAPLQLDSWKDLLMRFPYWAINKRPGFIQENNTIRTVFEKKSKPQKKE